MSHELTLAPASSMIWDVANKLFTENVDAVILTENNIPTGIFTERHVLNRVVNAGLDAKTTPAASVMTAPIRAVSEDTPIVDALGEMFQRRIRHMVVHADSNTKVIGVISMRRILQMVVEIGHGVNETRTVGEIMAPNPLAVDESTPVSDTINRMIENDTGAIVVTREAAPMGIFTERDVLRRIVLKEIDPRKTEIQAVMTTSPITMPKNIVIGKVLDEMHRRRIRNMPVCSAAGELAGLVSMPEIIQYARALDIDDAVRRSWKDIQEYYDSLDIYTPG